MKCVHIVAIENTLTLARVMVQCQAGDNPLPELMINQSTVAYTRYCASSTITGPGSAISIGPMMPKYNKILDMYVALDLL